MESVNDKYSIRNLLFTKSIPNHTVPAPSSGHQVYGCSDCGDKFLFKSSLDYHLDRKSVKISYFCRPCATRVVFYNRCNLLAHIRSHTFKSATINVSDLKVEPLPLSFFNFKGTSVKNAVKEPERKNTQKTNSNEPTQNALGLKINSNNEYKCPECDENIDTEDLSPQGIAAWRIKHFNVVTEVMHTCPVCLYALSTMCAFKTHLRIHFQVAPFFCPDCGNNLSSKSVQSPYMDHNCEGFKLMRASARLMCPAPDCHIISPEEIYDHITKQHLQIVYKCPECYVACFDEEVMLRHLSKKHSKADWRQKQQKFYQCLLCTGKLIVHTQINNHLQNHKFEKTMFPCWVCGETCDQLLTLIEHHLKEHNFLNTEVREWFRKIIESQKKLLISRKSVRIVGKCDHCLRSFTYKCGVNNVDKIAKRCPYRCTKDKQNNEGQIICSICKIRISQNWEDVKIHFKEHHQAYKCLDAKIIVSRMNINKYLDLNKTKTPGKIVKKVTFRYNRKRNRNGVKTQNPPQSGKKGAASSEGTGTNPIGEFTCKKCGQDHENKQLLEKHLLSHRDLCMAYQCMECGQCFVVKPSFSKHMLLEHNITSVDDYIAEKQCYNENALQKYQDQPVSLEPLKENQCKVCREQFDNSADLEKHFRVHGMAFLMKNNSNKSVSP